MSASRDDGWKAEKTIHIDVQNGDSPVAQVPANTPTDIVYQHFIDGVHFDRTVMSPGGTCSLDIHTVFTGAGCPVTVELKDETGSFDTLDATMNDWQRSFEVTVPYDAKGHVRAVAELEGGKEPVTSSGVVRLTDPVVPRDVKWSADAAHPGDVVELSVLVNAAANGHRAFFRVYETHGYGDGLHRPVWQAKTVVQDERAVVQW